MMKRILKVIISIVIVSLFLLSPVFSQSKTRKETYIPSLEGYIPLKCDFHMHTVFSDGNVWPTVRVNEAWREGLNAIAITDHVEERYHYNNVNGDPDEAYRISLPLAKRMKIILIKGAEITRPNMPPGHYNALFIDDIGALDKPDVKEAVKAAYDQNAFITWNHPGYPVLPGGPDWFPIHTELYDNGMLHGIEVVNGHYYVPEAHQWALDRNLTLLGFSDLHDPSAMEYDFAGGEHRSYTIVYVKEATIDGIKEALFARRTVIHFMDKLIGYPVFLREIFNKSVVFRTKEISLRGDRWGFMHVENKSGIPIRLSVKKPPKGFAVQRIIDIPPRSIASFTINSKNRNMDAEKVLKIRYEVDNMLVAPGKGLSVEQELKVKVKPRRKK